MYESIWQDSKEVMHFLHTEAIGGSNPSPATKMFDIFTVNKV